MKAATGMILSFVWMLAVFLVGFIVIANLTKNATANASGALIGDAATNWTNLVSYIWVAISLVALTPLVMVIPTAIPTVGTRLVFAGLFGQLGGGKAE